MLTLRRIEIEGFGPFAERQRIDFPSERGVIAIYGPNMRGKTSLLNAIKYAFFGMVPNRSNKLLTSNRDRAAQGSYGFSVELTFMSNEREFELVRDCVPRDSKRAPANDSEFEQRVLLRSGGNVLCPQQRDQVLAQVLPEQVSRFFLFDGEMLQEYEQLLDSGSEAGRTISDAIERILGVPILKSGRMHLSILLDDADRAAAKAAKRSERTAALGSALEQLSEQRSAQKSDLVKQQKLLAKLQAEKAESERYLQSYAGYAAILSQRDTATAELTKLAESKEQTQVELRDAMKEAWRGLIAKTVRTARDSAQAEVENILINLELSLRRRAINTQHCGTCDRGVDRATIERLIPTLPDETTQACAEMDTLAMVRLSELNRFEDHDVSGTVRQIFQRLNELKVAEAHLKDRVRDFNTQLGDANVDVLRSSSVSLGATMKKIVVAENAIEAIETKIVTLDGEIHQTRTRLDAMGSSDLRALQARSSLLRSAYEVLERSVERYKHSLREDVQRSASELFLRMTTEKQDYVGLEISSNYGLRIRHRDGRVEEGRSAGAAHVVAFALMAALQKTPPCMVRL